MPGAGVFRSSDGGATWGRRSQGLPATRTRNGGADWVSVGPPFSLVGALVFDRNQPRSLYGATYYGLVRSLDDGETWAQAAFASAWVSAFAIDPSNDSSFFAAVFHQTDQNISSR